MSNSTDNLWFSLTHRETIVISTACWKLKKKYAKSLAPKIVFSNTPYINDKFFFAMTAIKTEIKFMLNLILYKHITCIYCFVPPSFLLSLRSLFDFSNFRFVFFFISVYSLLSSMHISWQIYKIYFHITPVVFPTSTDSSRKC